MTDFIKTLPQSELNLISKKQKTEDKLLAQLVSPLNASSPTKESKNARKKRERKELEKKLQASASKHR